ncbi:MAG: RNA polymerase sigma-70 factor [Ferruginibacter sp.]|nr:RNA polymerase sigma-70 factor [Cytophagales bacterium]
MIGLLRQGNHQAFEEIYHRYWTPLYAYTYNRLRSRQVCEELVQGVFLTLWVKRDTPGAIVSLSAYLFTGVKYRMLNEMKAERVRRDFAASFTAFQTGQHSRATDEAVAVGDLQSALETLVDQLPPKCRQVFQLSRLEHQSIADISNALNVSPKTVESQLTKALKHLRLGLREFFLCWLAVLFNG